MGGKSKSKTQQTTTTDNSQEVRDFTGASAELLVGGNLDQSSTTSVGGDLTLTDFGAVELAFAGIDSAGARATDLQRDAMNSVATLGATQLNAARQQNKEIADLASRFEAGDDERNRKMMLYLAAGLAVTVVAVIVAANWSKK